MERVGRHRLTLGSQDYAEEQEVQLPLFSLVKSDLDGFLQELLDRVTVAGGFAAVGAACTAWNLLADDQRHSPTYTAIMKGGADSAKGMNYNRAQVPPFIGKYWSY
jgi:hypothetical protein